MPLAIPLLPLLSLIAVLEGTMVIFVLCLRDDFHLLNDEFNKLMLFFQKRSHVLQPKGTYRFHEFISALHVHKAWGPEVLTGIGLPVLRLQPPDSQNPGQEHIFSKYKRFSYGYTIGSQLVYLGFHFKD